MREVEWEKIFEVTKFIQMYVIVAFKSPLKQ